MRKRVVLAALGVVGATMSVAGAGAASAAPTTGTHVAQYKPNVPTTAPADVSDITTTPPRGAGDTAGSGALPTTGSDSTRLAGQGLALVVAGSGLVLIRRRYADRPQPTRR